MAKPSRKSRAAANARASQPQPKTAEPIAAAESVKQARRVRWNPLRNLTPDTLTRALDAFEYGDLREFALLAEVIADRDDTIKSVKPKREKATAARDWKVMKRDKSPEAEKHQQILQEFWQNVKAVNAYDRNERGGMGRLIKQMMTSVSYRYAAHHIVWDPKPGKLRATFEFVPLWFFENREGKLRFIKDGVGVTGEDLEPREWMVTCGDGLMIACAIGYLGKRYCIQDWLAFSEKFSMPGILGATSAAKGSSEGNAMKAAVESFSQDWSAVMYGVTDPSKPPIHLIQPDGNPTAMPMPAYIERTDRKNATLFMGQDLSTMSSKDGQGTGASLQGDELSNLITDDCMTISETLQEVEREVLRWHFGDDVEPLAYIEVQPPVRVDNKFILEAIKVLTEMGVRLPVTEILESLGFSEADAADAALADLVKKPEAGGQKPGGSGQKSEEKIPAANAMDAVALSEWLFEIRSALAKDLQPLGDALMGALEAGDLPAMQAALRKISEGMPELAGDADNLAEVLAIQFADAWLGDENPEPAANSGTPDGARKGWEARRTNGWRPANRPGGTGNPKKRQERGSIEEVLDAAFDDTDSRDFVNYSTVTAAEAETLQEGAPVDVTGWQRRVEADVVNKILSKHSADAFPVTEEDFRKLPALHRQAIATEWQQQSGGEWRLKTIARDGRDLWIIEQARTGQSTLNLISMYRP